MNQIINNVEIIGSGSYVPQEVFTNSYLEKMANTSDAWIQDNLGIKERHIASETISTGDLATWAALNAIDDAGLTVDDIDLIIVATATPDRLAPSTACIVQDYIQAYHAVCFDLNAVCSGFLFALSMAAQLVSNRIYKNALIIGADTFSKITDWSSRDCVYFGDGAGAVVIRNPYFKNLKDVSISISVAREAVSNDPLPVISMRFQLYSDGRGRFDFTVPRGEKYFKMNGRAVYNKATSALPIAINQILKDNKLTIADIDYLIPHQAGIRVLKKTAELIGLPFEKVLTNMDRYGNTAGASIPILMDEARRSGKLEGKLVLLAAVGSGWTWGVGLIKF